MALAISLAVRCAAASIVSGPTSCTALETPLIAALVATLPTPAPIPTGHQHARQLAACRFDLRRSERAPASGGHLVCFYQGLQLGPACAKSDEHARQTAPFVDDDEFTANDRIADAR